MTWPIPCARGLGCQLCIVVYLMQPFFGKGACTCVEDASGCRIPSIQKLLIVCFIEMFLKKNFNIRLFIVNFAYNSLHLCLYYKRKEFWK